MATLDKVRIQYETDFDDATKELGKFNKEQEKVDKQAKKNQKTFESNAQKRERILKEEIRDLRELEKRSNAAFEPDVVADYNKQISSTKDRIRTLTTEQGKTIKAQGQFNSLLLKGAGLLAGAFAIDRILSFGSSLLQTAKDLETFQRRSGIVFGQASESVARFARVNALSLGFTKNEFIGAAAAIGDLLVPLGFAREKAAEMAPAMLKVAAASKEFSGDTRDASAIAKIFARSLTGEVEGLKQLQIVVNQNDKEFKDLVKTKIRDEGATEAQAKALAIYETILISAKDATDSYERSTSTLTRTTEQMAAELRQTQEDIADEVTPAVNNLATSFLQLIKVIKFINNPVKQLREQELLKLEKQLLESTNVLDEFIRVISQGGTFAPLTKATQQYANTLLGLNKRVKDTKDDLLKAELGTESFTKAEIALKEAQDDLLIAQGKLTDEQKDAIRIQKELEKIAEDKKKEAERLAKEAKDRETKAINDLRSAEEQEAKDAEELATRVSQDALDRDDEFFDAELEKSIEANEALAEEQFEADIKEREAARKQAEDLLLIEQQKQEAKLQLIRSGGELSVNLIRAFGNQQAIQSKEFALFQIAISQSVAIAEAIKDAQVAGLTPVDKAIILATSLASIAGGIAQARQILNSEPVPQFATGTKDFTEGGIAEVGERGRERVILPAHSMVLAHSPTVKYKAELDAMQDGTYENFIQKKIAQSQAPEMFDDGLLRRAIKNNKSVRIENIGDLSRVFSQQNYFNKRYSSS